MNLPEIRITSVFGRPVESGTPLYKGLRLFGLTPRQPSPQEKERERRSQILKDNPVISLEDFEKIAGIRTTRPELTPQQKARREERLRRLGL